MKFYTFFLFAFLGCVSVSAQVKVIGAVEPNDLSDKYPTHNELYGKGGFRSVANLTDRNTITPARRNIGMLVYCIENEKFYQLKGGILDANWVETNFGSGGGAEPITIIPIEKGGTGASTADEARTNLGLGSLAIQNKDAVEITNGAIDGTLIGALAPAKGKFTTLEVNSELTVTGQVIVNGDLKATGDVTANSDIRIKKNIKTLEPVSQSLRQLHAVSYDRRDIELYQIGFIAQNVQTFFPSLVKVDNDKRGTLSLNYQTITVPLLKGWQEHDEIIVAQQKEIVKLNAEMQLLKDAISQIKELVAKK